MNFKGFILTLGCFVAGLSAAMNYNIHGIVSSAKDDKPIQGAVVTLLQHNVADTTESDGSFLLENLDSSATDSSEKKEQDAQGIRSSLGHKFQVSDAGYSQIFSVNGRQIYGNRFTKNAYIYYARNLGASVQATSESNRNLKKESAEVASEIFDTLLVEASGHLSKKIALTNNTEEVNVTLDTIPLAAIIKQGAGSSSQQVAQNSAIVDFSFKIANADSATVKGCPKGVEVKFENGTLYFSGKVTDAVGTYEYTVSTIGGYNTATRSGKFTVIEAEAAQTTTTTPEKLVADGYASLNGGTTGGAGGDTVVVSTYAAFKAAIQTDKPKVVIVKGTIKTTDGDGYGLGIYSNTTIMGADSSATIYGGLTVNGKKNVIIYNINIHGTYPNPGPSDGIAVSHGATNVWIHHVNIWDAEDGNLDITTQASYVTVSYVHFWYTDPNHPHRLNALIGSGASNHPEDFNKLKVTYHHCWFGTLVNERMPRVMYGNAHIYNNYYTATDNLYGVGVGSYGSALIENNYFYKTHNPIIFMYNVYAYINTKNNVYDNVTTSSNSSTTPVVANNGGKIYGERYITTDPYTLLEDPAKLDKVPYEYTMDKAADVPNIVKKQVGPHNY